MSLVVIPVLLLLFGRESGKFVPAFQTVVTVVFVGNEVVVFSVD